MQNEINRMVSLFEQGKMTRRQLVAHLSAFAAAMAGASTARAETTQGGADEPTFKARRIDHLALSVTDVPRSRDWYVKHLGLELTDRDSESSCFLDCGDDFLALFRGDEPGLHHFSFAIDDYDAGAAMERIEEAGLNGRRRSNRVYFDDPDGLVVQVASG